MYRDRNNKTIMSMKKEERLVIEVNNLVKRYGDHTAVDHLSFKIEKGKTARMMQNMDLTIRML